MNIVHICIQTPYNDDYGYQDNLLPKYHRKQGHDVTVITTNTKHHEGKIIEIDTDDYTLPDGQRIIRLKAEEKRLFKILKPLKIHNYYELLCEIKPDLIMVHGLGDFSAYQVAKYVDRINPDCKVVADNHLDYNIGKGFLQCKHKFLYKWFNIKMQKYYKVVYGVTPWRIEFMQKVFGIKKCKSDLLVMGGDDEKIMFDRADEIRSSIRQKHNINNDDFLVVSGGKIDKNKNIHLLMQAVADTKLENIKLIVFGQPIDEMESVVEYYAHYDNIRYIGWIPADKSYDYFLASDLAVFPGQHSVLWEQACACGLPGVYKRWHGMDHVDVGGNCLFLDECSIQEIKKTIENIACDNQLYERMKKVALSDGVKRFSYDSIAKKVTDCAEVIK